MRIYGTEDCSSRSWGRDLLVVQGIPAITVVWIGQMLYLLFFRLSIWGFT